MSFPSLPYPVHPSITRPSTAPEHALFSQTTDPTDLFRVVFLWNCLLEMFLLYYHQSAPKERSLYSNLSFDFPLFFIYQPTHVLLKLYKEEFF